MVECLLLSLKKKTSAYKPEEADFLFKLFCFLALDSSTQVVNMKVQVQKILETLIDMYVDEESVDKQLSESLVNFVLTMKSEISAELCDEGENKENHEDLNSKESIFRFNNVYHRALYLINYFKITYSKRLNRVSANLAYTCFVHLFETNLDANIIINDNKIEGKTVNLSNFDYVKFEGYFLIFFLLLFKDGFYYRSD